MDKVQDVWLSVKFALKSRLPNEVDWALQVLQQQAGKASLDKTACDQVLDELLLCPCIDHFVCSDLTARLVDVSLPRPKPSIVDMFTTPDEPDPDRRDYLDLYELRLTQVSDILRSFSLDPTNLVNLATNKLVLNFIMRGLAANNARHFCKLGVRDEFHAIHTHRTCLRKSCSQTFANVSAYILLSEVVEGKEFLIQHMVQGLYSDDRDEICNSLQSLGQLCTVEVDLPMIHGGTVLTTNKDELCACVTTKVLNRFAQLLLVEDVQLCLYLLETMYKLTLWTEFAEALPRVDGVVSILAGRISFELQDFSDLPNTAENHIARVRSSGDQPIDLIVEDAIFWLTSNFLASNNRSECMSRKELYQSYVFSESGRSVLSQHLFCKAIQKVFPNVETISPEGVERSVLYIGIKPKSHTKTTWFTHYDSQRLYPTTLKIAEPTPVSTSETISTPIVSESSASITNVTARTTLSPFVIPQVDGGADEYVEESPKKSSHRKPLRYRCLST